ncbi:hypothetical protein [Phenylobacterium soli]|uniref:Uncharacterized protein n=1 Tax=Phenylobacterium soli TaxID=2170551 RepID=A0A328AMH3_9CAUL|nr:hypothetical protein [Phenylobacterium soli]RAK55611.1 hypothetical protein DJ017_14385 [Phenylobacterium soli]
MSKRSDWSGCGIPEIVEFMAAEQGPSRDPLLERDPPALAPDQKDLHADQPLLDGLCGPGSTTSEHIQSGVVKRHTAFTVD